MCGGCVKRGANATPILAPRTATHYTARWFRLCSLVPPLRLSRPYPTTTPMPDTTNPARSRLAQRVQAIKDLPFIVWLVFGCALLWGVFGSLLGAMAPEVRVDLSLSYVQLGHVMAVWSIGGALGSFIGGSVARISTPQRLFFCYACCTLVALCLVIAAQGYWSLMIGLGLIAIFETALFTLGHGLLAGLRSKQEERTRLISMADVGYSFGSMLSPWWVIVVFAIDPLWRWPYVSFVLLILALIWFTAKPARFAGVALAPHDSSEALNHGYFWLLRQPLLRWVLLAAFFIGYAEWGQYFWVVSYAVSALHLGDSDARMVLSCLMTGMLLGRLWQAFVRTRYGLRLRILWLGALGLLALLLLVLSPLWGGLGFAATCSVNFTIGLGMSVVFPILLGHLVHAWPGQASRLSALLMIAIIAGSVLAASGVGLLAQRWGMAWAYSTPAIAMLLYFLCVLKVFHGDADGTSDSADDNSQCAGRA